MNKNKIEFIEFLTIKRNNLIKELQPFYERYEQREAACMNVYGVATFKEKNNLRELERITKLLSVIEASFDLDEVKSLLESSLSADNKYTVEFQLDLINQFLDLKSRDEIPYYEANKLPDFFSVRNVEQINYSFEGMEGKKCFCFFDNGFNSNIIEGNKRDIRFIWDGFILFTDKSYTLEDLQNGVNLYDSRLVALQRVNLMSKKANSLEVREYIINLLDEKNISYEIMPDKHIPIGNYPSKCDLWSTRESAVLLDAIDCVGNGDAYFFKDNNFMYTINFSDSKIKPFIYSHKGALVLRGENSTAISRIIEYNSELQEQLMDIIGEDKLKAYLTGEEISGTSIDNVKRSFK